jgi:hypothetical protein
VHYGGFAVRAASRLSQRVKWAKNGAEPGASPRPDRGSPVGVMTLVSFAIAAMLE